MRDRRVALVVAALLLGACTVEPGVIPGREEPLALPGAPAPTPGFGVLTTRGVAAGPCPGSPNPDNGCIHLGAVVDTAGPGGELAGSALEGARAFWERVAREGGVTHHREDGLVARFDVTLDGNVVEATDGTEARAAFTDLEPDVVALGLVTGTTTTSALLPELLRTDTAAVPLSWWSGWAFEVLVAESGASACLQAVGGLDWALAQLGGDPAAIDHVVAVHHPDRSGEDVVAGVEHWADPDHRDHGRVPFDRVDHAVTVAPDGDVGPAVERIDVLRPEVVVVAASPTQLAEIATRTAALGWDGLLVGTADSYTPSLLDDPDVADVLTSRYWHVGVVPPLASPARAFQDMRAASPGPEDAAWVAGWVGQYPLLHAFRDAITAGDLTPAGVRHALEQVSVDYDGALPRSPQHGAPDARVVRRTFPARPAADAPLGLRDAEAFVGDTVAAMHLTRPCTDT